MCIPIKNMWCYFLQFVCQYALIPQYYVCEIFFVLSVRKSSPHFHYVNSAAEDILIYISTCTFESFWGKYIGV